MTGTTATTGTTGAVGALATAGELLEWPACQYVLLTSPDRWLLVEHGHVDLFAVALRDGEPHGPWVSVGRLGPGDVVAGPIAGPVHRLLCRRVEDAAVRFVGLGSLRATVNEAPEPGASARPMVGALAAGIESGIMTLSRLHTELLPPRDFTALSAAPEVHLAAGEVARPVDGLLWLHILDGALDAGGSDRLGYHRGDPVCLTRQDWVVAAQQTTVRCATTHELVTENAVWRPVIVHSTRFLYTVDRWVERQGQAAQERIERARDRDDAALGRIRTRADRMLSAVRGAPLLVDDRASTGHLTAVQLVLDHLGADSVPPRHRRHVLAAATDYDEFGRIGWVRTRPVRLDGTWWTSELGPLATLWGPERLPAALIPSDGGYLVTGAAFDEPIRVTRENQHHARRSAWVVYPLLPAAVRDLWGLMRFGTRGLRREWWLFWVTSLLIGGVGLLTPVLIGQVLGQYVPAANRPLIVQGGVAVLLSALVGAAFAAVQNLTVLRLQGLLTARVQTAVWGRLLQLPVPFFDRHSTGRLGSIVLGVKSAQDVLSGAVVTAGLGLVVVMGNLVLIFFFSLPLALAGLVLALLGLAVGLVAGRADLTVQREHYAQEQRLAALMYEVLSAMGKIRAAAAEERALTRWSAQNRAAQAQVMRSRRLQDAVVVFNGAYPVLCLAVLFLLSTLLGADRPSLADLLSFLTAFSLMLGSLLMFTGTALAAVPVLPMLEGLAPLLAEEPESGADKAHPGDLSGRVSLRQVSFRYGHDGPLVLDNVSLEVAPGEFVAVVGPSGSGKSTVVRLVLGLDRPHTGSILFDGQDLSELDVSAVRRQCGVVLQAGALMAGNIRENIAGSSTYTDDEIWEAIEMAALADDVRAMPMKLATVVNESSNGLSGGQLQRLMIARALVSRPRLVLLDEATSALDNPTQAVVAEATRKLNATRIVVAHRLSTVRDADRIVVMDRGRIVQTGTYATLLADRGGLFAALAREQLS